MRLSGPLKKQYAVDHGLDYQLLLSASDYKEQHRLVRRCAAAPSCAQRCDAHDCCSLVDSARLLLVGWPCTVYAACSVSCAVCVCVSVCDVRARVCKGGGGMSRLGVGWPTLWLVHVGWCDGGLV